MIPSPPTPRRSDHDEKHSIQLAMAASMLRRGRDPHAVAEATKAPLALVELINEHLDPTPTSPSRPQPSNPGRTPTTDPPDHHASTGLDPQACLDGLHHHRRCTRVILTALLGWVASTVLIIAAGVFHLPALGAASMILTLVLVTALLRTVNRPTHHPTGTKRPLPGAGSTPARHAWRYTVMTTQEMGLRQATGLGLGAPIRDRTPMARPDGRAAHQTP